MSWGPNSRWQLRAAAVAFALTAVAADANVLILRSIGPSATAYPVGRMLPDNARIVLRADDLLVILSPRGTRTFRGAGVFTPNGPVQIAVADVPTSDRRVRIGAVRQADLTPRPPSVWHVDVTKSGRVCVNNPAGVVLWRPDAAASATLTVSGPGGTGTATWPAGHTTLAWPAGVPVTNGQTYQLSWSGTNGRSQVTIETVATPPADAQAVAQTLIANGCQNQLDALIVNVPKEETASR